MRALQSSVRRVNNKPEGAAKLMHVTTRVAPPNSILFIAHENIRAGVSLG
jgi:hypothetical protein